MSSLEFLGWSPFFENQIDPETERDLVPVRVIEEQRDRYRVRNAAGVFAAEPSGRLLNATTRGAALPCVGDWVLVRGPLAKGSPALVRRTLERRSCFSRKAPGTRTEEQVIAANVDTVFLVQSLNHDFNPRRMERYLALLWDSGAEPVILLNKSDLVDDPAPFEAEIAAAAPGVPIRTVSALESRGLDALEPWLTPGRTIALVGSSGVGKSTLLNRLAGEEVAAVADIREDGRGRHTTTSRRLIALESGALLVDTPGMRTVMLWDSEDGVDQVFDDIAALAAQCRFSDCSHASEPGCAIQAARVAGELDETRWHAWDKLRREAKWQAAKADVRIRIEQQKKWKKIHLEARRRPDKRRPHG